MRNRSLQRKKPFVIKNSLIYRSMIFLSSQPARHWQIFSKRPRLCATIQRKSVTGSWARLCSLLKEKEMEPEDIHFSPEHLAQLIELAEAGTINSTVAKEVFEKVFEEDIDPKQYVEEKGLGTVNDEGALRSTIEEIVAGNPQSVEDYKAGKKKAIGFLVGQTMKAMQGKANPGMVNKILTEILDQ